MWIGGFKIWITSYLVILFKNPLNVGVEGIMGWIQFQYRKIKVEQPTQLETKELSRQLGHQKSGWKWGTWISQKVYMWPICGLIVLKSSQTNTPIYSFGWFKMDIKIDINDTYKIMMIFVLNFWEWKCVIWLGSLFIFTVPLLKFQQ